MSTKTISAYPLKQMMPIIAYASDRIMLCRQCSLAGAKKVVQVESKIDEAKYWVAL